VLRVGPLMSCSLGGLLGLLAGGDLCLSGTLDSLGSGLEFLASFAAILGLGKDASLIKLSDLVCILVIN